MAYPWLIVLLLAFIACQLYRITAVHFSVGLTALTVFDAALVWLTWREYQARRTRRHLRDPAILTAPAGSWSILWSPNPETEPRKLISFQTSVYARGAAQSGMPTDPA